MFRFFPIQDVGVSLMHSFNILTVITFKITFLSKPFDIWLFSGDIVFIPSYF